MVINQLKAQLHLWLDRTPGDPYGSSNRRLNSVFYTAPIAAVVDLPGRPAAFSHTLAPHRDDVAMGPGPQEDAP
jgi:hypothetical protein